ncbi:unnamed protein product [Rotaria sp. Silwood1]|nr:unnamed protein product [Rotaria sp. Silwood1]CAF1628884.1 unnamed protein product [Rotaria sp. Silwood1]
MIRRLKDGQQNSENSAVQDKNGKLLISSRDKLGRRKEYFYELLNVKSIVDSNVIYHIKTLSIPTTERDRQNKPLTLEELDQVLKRMKSQEGRDNDDVSADKFKVGELSLLRWLHEIFVDIWQNEGIVDHWILAFFIRFFKNKGDKKQCDNYLDISLLVVASTLFTGVILHHLQKLIDK